MKSIYSTIVQKTKMLKESVANVLGIQNNTYNQDIRVLEHSKIASSLAINDQLQDMNDKIKVVYAELGGIENQLGNIYRLLAGESRTSTALNNMNTSIEAFSIETGRIAEALSAINDTLANLSTINSTLESGNTIDEHIKDIMSNWIINNNLGGE